MITLTKSAKPRARIIILADPASVEHHAAEELQRFICEISGAELPITDTPSKEQTNIFIGGAAPLQGLGLSEEALGFDGYIVKTIGADIILTGAKSYSCLYAVYHLLERHLGCGFFEDGDQVPRRETIEIADLDDTCKPRFEWRFYFVSMQYAYSSMRWWDWEEFKPWVEWLVKKRYNMLDACRLVEYCGITALAATKLGVPIELTPYQRKQIALMRRTLDYARMMGIRIVYPVSQYSQGNVNAPGTYSYVDRIQLEEFVRRYGEKTGDQIPMTPYRWCEVIFRIMDPRHPVTKKFATALVEAYGEALGTDHMYSMLLPSEGAWASDDLEEMNRITYSMVGDMVAAIKAGDPQSTVCCPPPFPYAKTFETQKQVVRDVGLPILAGGFLNMPGRLHSFLMLDYYWGLPWTTGMTVQCGKETNPGGDLRLVIRNARELAADPQASECIGFGVGSEMNHRNLMMMDLFGELAWNPADVEPEEYLRRWPIRRYGPDLAEHLQSVTDAVASTLLSFHNLDIRNGSLYRHWRGGYLPGLTSESVKRSIGYLPKLRLALETLLGVHEQLKESPMYRFDLVDLGRTYLGIVFNHRLGQSRKALRAQDRVVFDRHAREIEELMHFIARYVSADPQFRLKTHDDWASGWPQILPGHENQESNWITFTALISPEVWQPLLDYVAEDLAELVEHYYWPRVKLYLQKMRELLETGKDISGRLVYRGTDTDMPYRVSDWAPPQGNLPWSAYGATNEPELTAEDDALAHQIIERGSMSGQFDFYEGPLDCLVRELLDRYPVPDDQGQVSVEVEPGFQAGLAKVLEGKPGEAIMGFRTPAVVEKVVVPKELGYLVNVERLSKQYNIMRGDIASYTVVVSDYLKLTRMPDEKASVGSHNVAVFEFDALDRRYRLRYDGGSDFSPAALFIDPVRGE